MKVYESQGKSPEFDISRSMFRVTLFAIADKTDVFKGEGTFTRNDLEIKEKVSKSKATQIINEMIGKGLIVRQGNGKNSRYKWA